MTKERKNIITRESCQKDLKHVVTAGFKYSLVVLAAVLFFLLPISLIVGATTWFLSIFALVFVAVLIHNILRIRMVNQGRFSIVKDMVVTVSKGEMERRHSVNAIYFATHGRYVPSQTAFHMSSEGDVFYLVILHTKKKEIFFAFHSELYDCDASELDLTV